MLRWLLAISLVIVAFFTGMFIGPLIQDALYQRVFHANCLCAPVACVSDEQILRRVEAVERTFLRPDAGSIQEDGGIGDGGK